VSVVGSAHLIVEHQLPNYQPPGKSTGPQLPSFATGLASGAALFAVIVSAFLVRTRVRSAEGKRLAAELTGGVEIEGQGLAEEADGLRPGSGAG